jgi:hypothetical protein
VYAFRRLPVNTKTEQRDWPNGSWVFFVGTQVSALTGLRAHLANLLLRETDSCRLQLRSCAGNSKNAPTYGGRQPGQMVFSLGKGLYTPAGYAGPFAGCDCWATVARSLRCEAAIVVMVNLIPWMLYQFENLRHVPVSSTRC